MKAIRGLRFLRGVALALASYGCTAIVDSDIKPGGIGAACASENDCQAGTCGDDNLCTAACGSDGDCPAPTACFAGSCRRPLKVGAMWVGVSAGGEGWTLTHDQGMQAASAALPYLSWSKKENIVSDDDIGKTIDDFVAAGTDVVVANSYSQRDATLKKAAQYPNVKFIICESYLSQGNNADSYAAHGEQAWWVAGRVAGSKSLASKSHRLGFVGSFITPETVRHSSAFLLGAKSVDPMAQVEVQWMGFWSDTSSAAQFKYKAGTAAEKTYFYEEYLAQLLIDHGAVVVGHASDNQRVVRLVEGLTQASANSEKVYSVSNDNPQAFRALAVQSNGDSLPTGPPLATCLGSPSWNWAPLYERIFRAMHAGDWKPTTTTDPMTNDPATSIVGFNLNPTVGIDDSVVESAVNDVASKGWQSIYAGPYQTTGQRDKNLDGVVDTDQTVVQGDTLTDAEYSRMCWFPEGMIERFPEDSDDPKDDRPARVPDAKFVSDPAYAAKRAEMTKAAFPGLSFDCTKNH